MAQITLLARKSCVVYFLVFIFLIEILRERERERERELARAHRGERETENPKQALYPQCRAGCGA